ncbi:DUF3667 domain-containing protein [Bacteroidota bacterium]
MKKNLETVICKNCSNKFQGYYCNICGQKVIKSRFTFRIFIIDAIESAFNLENGFFFTIQQLLKNPGKVLIEYLNGRTKDYYNPIIFLILLVGLSALITVMSNSFDNSIQYTTDLTNNITELPKVQDPFVIKIQSFLKSYLNVFMILFVPFYTIGFRLLFSRSKLYYTEHLIINCYAFGTVTLIGIVAAGILIFIPNTTGIEAIIGWLILISIYPYFYHKVTEKSFIGSFFLSILSMIIGLVLFMTIFMIIAYAILIVMKKLGMA